MSFECLMYWFIAIVIAFWIYDYIVEKIDAFVLQSGPLFLKNREYDRNDTFVGYPNAWYILAKSRDLKKNQVIPLSLCEREIVLFRGSTGKAYVLSAYCCHLGANIGIGGKSLDTEGKDCIMCPFHGWTFDGSNGKCVKIPNLESNEIPVNAKIDTWTILEQDSLIYAWCDSEGNPPRYYPEKLGEKYGFDMSIMTSTRRIPIYNNIEVLQETHFDFESQNYIYSTIIPVLLTMRITGSVISDEDEEGVTANTTEHRDRRVHFTTSLFALGVPVGTIDETFTCTSPAVLHSKLTITLGTYTTQLMYVMAATPTEPMHADYVAHIVTKSSLRDRFVGKMMTIAVYIFNSHISPIWANSKMPREPAYTENDQAIVALRQWTKQFYYKPKRI